MRRLCLFPSQATIEPKTERTPTVGRGDTALRREQYLLEEVLGCLQKEWSDGVTAGRLSPGPNPAEHALDRWISQRKKPPEIEHLVTLAPRLPGAGSRSKQPPLVDAVGAVAVVEMLINKEKDKEKKEEFLKAFREAWGWADAADATAEGRAHQDAPARDVAASQRGGSTRDVQAGAVRVGARVQAWAGRESPAHAEVGMCVWLRGGSAAAGQDVVAFDTVLRHDKSLASQLNDHRKTMALWQLLVYLHSRVMKEAGSSRQTTDCTRLEGFQKAAARDDDALKMLLRALATGNVAVPTEKQFGKPPGWTVPEEPRAEVTHLRRPTGTNAAPLPGHLPGNVNPDHELPVFK